MAEELDDFYATVHSTKTGQQGPKHVGDCILKHYCHSNDVFAFGGHIVITES
jgi:hypothetical protein